MRLILNSAALGVIALAAFAADSPAVVGGVSSKDGVEIDGTWMGPSPSWPVADTDKIQTAEGSSLILTTDRNAITLMPRTRVRVRAFNLQQTWVFVEQGGLSVDTKTSGVFICIASRLFQPSASARASLVLEKNGGVSQNVQRGVLARIKVSVCSEENAAVLAASPAVVGAGTAVGSIAGTAAGASVAVAGGTATAAAGVTSAAAATIGAAGGVTAAASLAATTGSSAATTCTTPAGCNFNPPPISASTP